MGSWLQSSLIILVILGMGIGLFGLFIPFFPGIIVIWASIFGFGLLHGFSTGGILIFAAETLLWLASMVVDNLLMGAGAAKRGASWLSVGLSMVAFVVGSLFFTPLIGLLISFGSVFLVELVRLGNAQQAWQALKGMLTGFGLTFVVRFIIGLVMIALWAVWYFFIP